MALDGLYVQIGWYRDGLSRFPRYPDAVRHAPKQEIVSVKGRGHDLRVADRSDDIGHRAVFPVDQDGGAVACQLAGAENPLPVDRDGLGAGCAQRVNDILYVTVMDDRQAGDGARPLSIVKRDGDAREIGRASWRERV